MNIDQRHKIVHVRLDIIGEISVLKAPGVCSSLCFDFAIVLYFNQSFYLVEHAKLSHWLKGKGREVYKYLLEN